MDSEDKRRELRDIVTRLKNEPKRKDQRAQVHVEYAGVLVNVMADGVVLPGLSELAGKKPGE